MSKNLCNSDKIVSRIGITPVGSKKYRVNRLRFHLLAYAIARKAQLIGKDAKFFVRCDDTDTSNTTRSFLDAYLEVLFSLGIVPDLIPSDRDENGFSLFQSEREDLYRMFVSRLAKLGLAFKDSSGAIFFHTEEFSKRFQHLIIDNKLSIEDVSMGSLSIDIRTPLKEKRGKMEFVPFPIVRSNGKYLFNLCSPVDDAMLGVTHVVRDRDKLNLLSNQEMVRISLGFPSLIYVHAPLLVNKEGKRFIHDEYWGDATFQDFIARGILPEALVSYLLSGFFGPSERYYKSLDDFSFQVDFSQLHRSNIVFTESVLKQHNKKALEFSSENGYKMALRKFLAYHDPAMLDSIDSNYHLLEVLVRMKREFLESCRIIEDLLHPKYDTPDVEHVQTLNLIMAFFLRWRLDELQHCSYEDVLIKMASDHSRSMGISKKEYYRAIRYLLTGRYQGCDLHEVVQYLEKTGAISERLNMAKQELLKINLLVKNHDLQNGG